MSNKDVSMEHPMSANRRRISRNKIVEDSQEIFNKLDKEEVEKQEAKAEPIPKKRLKSLKELLYSGRLSKNVEIDGFIFTLETTTTEQNQELSKRLLKMSDEEKLATSNILLLAASLKKINGLNIPDAYEELFEVRKEASDLDLSLEIIGALTNHLTGLLINAYFELSKESSDMLKSSDENLGDIKK